MNDREDCYFSLTSSDIAVLPSFAVRGIQRRLWLRQFCPESTSSPAPQRNPFARQAVRRPGRSRRPRSWHIGQRNRVGDLGRTRGHRRPCPCDSTSRIQCQALTLLDRYTKLPSGRWCPDGPGGEVRARLVTALATCSVVNTGGLRSRRFRPWPPASLIH